MINLRFLHYIGTRILKNVSQGQKVINIIVTFSDLDRITFELLDHFMNVLELIILNKKEVKNYLQFHFFRSLFYLL